jgi:hypothetical protein
LSSNILALSVNISINTANMWFSVLIPIFCALSLVVSATAQPAHAGSGLATTHPTCYTGIAWFMCCDNWEGKKGSTASERAVEMSHKRILNERLYGEYGCGYLRFIHVDAKDEREDKLIRFQN